MDANPTGVAHALFALAQGETEALAAVQACCGRRMRSVATRLGGPDHADDIVHDALLAVLEAAGRFEPRGQADTAATAWILAVTANVARAHRRREHRRRSAATPELAEGVSTDVDPDLSGDLGASLYALPEADRRLVVARLRDHRDYAELAVERGCSVNALRIRLHRILVDLRARLRRRGYQPILIPCLAGPGGGRVAIPPIPQGSLIMPLTAVATAILTAAVATMVAVVDVPAVEQSPPPAFPELITFTQSDPDIDPPPVERMVRGVHDRAIARLLATQHADGSWLSGGAGSGDPIADTARAVIALSCPYRMTDPVAVSAAADRGLAYLVLAPARGIDQRAWIAAACLQRNYDADSLPAEATRRLIAELTALQAWWDSEATSIVVAGRLDTQAWLVARTLATARDYGHEVTVPELPAAGELLLASEPGCPDRPLLRLMNLWRSEAGDEAMDAYSADLARAFDVLPADDLATSATAAVCARILLSTIYFDPIHLHWHPDQASEDPVVDGDA